MDAVRYAITCEGIVIGHSAFEVRGMPRGLLRGALQRDDGAPLNVAHVYVSEPAAAGGAWEVIAFLAARPAPLAPLATLGPSARPAPAAECDLWIEAAAGGA
jgi:hypothetical protein